jgi:LysR family hydrogen peroxide-inducible transcriptional activator
MQYLVAVADLKSFSKASLRCHISQPTLSGQIKKLEETLGVTLFERNNKRVMLTQIGCEVTRIARRILQEVETMKATAKQAHNPLSGRFSLGAFPTLASYIFPNIVPKISRAMPQLQLMLVEEKTDILLAQLKAGTLDAALLALPVEDKNLVCKKLFNDPFYLAVAKKHPLAKRKYVQLGALESYDLLLLNEGHCLRNQALSVCHMAGVSESQDFRATSLETLREMVKAGSGITLMPEIAMKPDKAITYIPFKAPVPKRRIALVYRKTTPRKTVMDMLVKLLHKSG